MDPNFTCSTHFPSIQPEPRSDTASLRAVKTNANPCAVVCSAGLAHFPPQIDAGAFAGVFSAAVLACRALGEWPLWALGRALPRKGVFARIKGCMRNPDPLDHSSFHARDPSSFLQPSCSTRGLALGNKAALVGWAFKFYFLLFAQGYKNGIF